MRSIILSAVIIFIFIPSSQAYYDEYAYNSYSTNQYQYQYQYQNQFQNNNFSPKLDSLNFNYQDNFRQNSSFKPIVSGYEREGTLKSFLKESVAPNLDLKAYSGSKIENQSIHSSFSMSEGKYYTQSYNNVQHNEQQQVVRFDNFTQRDDWTIREQVTQIAYNEKNLVTSMEVNTTDVAGHRAAQKLDNIRYQTNTDYGRYNDLLAFAQNKASEPNTYGFDRLVNVMENLPEPARELAESFEMKVTQPNGQENTLNIQNLKWNQERLIGFDAEVINPNGIDIVSVEMKLNEQEQVTHVNLEVNGQARQIELNQNQTLEEATEGLMKGLNPVALLSGTDTQIGEGKVVYLAKGYNAQGLLANGSKEHKIDYGKPKFYTPKANTLKADIKDLEKTAPTITRNIVWNKNIGKTGSKQLTAIKQAITDKINHKLTAYNQQKIFKTADNQTIKRLDKQPFQVKGSKIINQGQFETEDGKIQSGLSFVLQKNELQAVGAAGQAKVKQVKKPAKAKEEKSGLHPQTARLMKQTMFQEQKEAEKIKEITVALIKAAPQTAAEKAKTDVAYKQKKRALQKAFSLIKDMPNSRKDTYGEQYKILEQSLESDWQGMAISCHKQDKLTYDIPGEEGRIKLKLENKTRSSFEHIIQNPESDKATGHIKLSDKQFQQDMDKHKFIVGTDNRPLAMIPAAGKELAPEVKKLLEEKGIMIMSNPDEMGQLINQNAIVPVLNGIGNPNKDTAPDYAKEYASILKRQGIQNAFAVPLYTRGKTFDVFTTGMPEGIKDGMQKVVKDSLLTNGMEMISCYSVQRDKITEFVVEHADNIKGKVSPFVLQVAYSGGAQPGVEFGTYFRDKVSMINVDGPMAEADISNLHSYTRLRASIIGDMYAVDRYPENSRIINLSDPHDGSVNMNIKSHDVFENDVTRNFITKTIVRQLETHFSVMTDDLEYIKR